MDTRAKWEEDLNEAVRAKLTPSDIDKDADHDADPYGKMLYNAKMAYIEIPLSIEP